VSLKLGLQQEDWLRAEKLVDSGEIVTCEVIGTNRGGVLVRFGRLSGFVPNSHLGGPARPDGIDEIKEELVGRFLPLVVIEVVQPRRRLVLSRRVAERLQRQNLIEELAAGQVRTGVVRSIVSFGAFVDLGGIDGLMHISEFGWQHIAHPSDVVCVGDEIQVYVLSVDKWRQRIGLSRKRLLPDPWDEVSAQLAVGDVVRGTVTSAKPFGVFVDVGEGVHGLIQNDGSPGVNDLYDIESASGGEVSVQVLNIDYVRHRIDLGLIDDVVVAELAPAREEEEALSGIEAAML
jgi:small subunit ribosomal protein S1